MLFSPYIPTNLQGNLDNTLLQKANQVILESIKIDPPFAYQTKQEIFNLLKMINSYYSNLIESEGTKPSDIEQALKNNYDTDYKKQKLQKLAIRYIEAQTQIKEWIKNGDNPLTKEFILKLHKFFYEDEKMKDYLIIEHNNQKIKMTPGEFRNKDVIIANHIAPDYKEIDSLMNQFENAYKLRNSMNLETKLLYIISAHHRFLWIHPFLDGNGRISRLLLDACFYYIELEGYGLWSISRGFAKYQEKYRKALGMADLKREGDYDGRGFLSLKNLIYYVDSILDIIQDQITYSQTLMPFDKLFDRIELFITLTQNPSFLNVKNQIIHKLPIYASNVLKEILVKGEIKRGDVKKLISRSDRTASDLIKKLIQMELIEPTNPKSTKSSLKIKIPVYYSKILFPELGK